MKKITILFIILILVIVFIEAKKDKSNKDYSKFKNNKHKSDQKDSRHYDKRKNTSKSKNRKTSYNHDSMKHRDHAKQKWSKKYNKGQDEKYGDSKTGFNKKQIKEYLDKRGSDSTVQEGADNKQHFSGETNKEKKIKYQYKKHGKKHEKQNELSDGAMHSAGTETDDVKFEAKKSYGHEKKMKHTENKAPHQESQVIEEDTGKIQESVHENIGAKEKEQEKQETRDELQTDNEKNIIPPALEQTHIEELQYISEKNDRLPDEEGKNIHVRDHKSKKHKKDKSLKKEKDAVAKEDNVSVDEGEEQAQTQDIPTNEESGTVSGDNNDEPDEKCQRDSDCPAGSCCHVSESSERGSGTCEEYMKALGEKCVSECQCEPGLSCVFPAPSTESRDKKQRRGVCVPPAVDTGADSPE